MLQLHIKGHAPADLSDTITIGRSLDSDLIIAMAGVSSNHAVIEGTESGDAWILDLSKNGTYLNGEYVGRGKRKQLRAGDILRFNGSAEAIVKTHRTEDFSGDTFPGVASEEICELGNRLSIIENAVTEVSSKVGVNAQALTSLGEKLKLSASDSTHHESALQAVWAHLKNKEAEQLVHEKAAVVLLWAGVSLSALIFTITVLGTTAGRRNPISKSAEILRANNEIVIATASAGALALLKGHQIKKQQKQKTPKNGSNHSTTSKAV